MTNTTQNATQTTTDQENTMNKTLTLTDEQVADLTAGMFTLNDHETMVLTGIMHGKALEARKHAQTLDNYTWNNSEGAGATYLRILRQINPTAHAAFVDRYGDPFSWRRTMEVVGR